MTQRMARMTLALVLSACTPGTVADTSGSAAESTTTALLETTTAAAPAPTIAPTTPEVEHGVGVRVVDGVGELFDRVTGETFEARGVNLIRLSGGSHSTLDVGRYDPDRIDATFAELSSNGFNVVRVFLNSRPGGMPGSDNGLSPEYMDNVVDLLERAKSHALQVILTQDWLPESSAWSFSSDPLIDNVNAMYLAQDGVETNRRFFGQWVDGLIERGAPFDALLAYELRNELYFSELYAPFSLDSETVTTANGASYDLAAPGAHRRLLEENLVFWVDEMRSEILSRDPSALVTVGFFQPKGPNVSRVGDDRLIETEQVILNSTLDFVDLHGYPGGELDLGQIVENYGLPPVTEKPILLGEFGAERAPYPTIDDAVRALVNWQIESCSYGFAGWLLWTWDTDEQPEFWTGIDEDMAIGGALSPAVRPDPCQVGDLDLAQELALGAEVRTSAGVGGTSLVDGLPDTTWSAGAGPVQWIEVDLGQARTVESVRLLVAQDPPGGTSHIVSARGESGDWREIAALTGDTSDGQWLEVPLAEPLEEIRYIGVETVTSPSWVAWREISILGK
jgi:hypothetical protein